MRELSDDIPPELIRDLANAPLMPEAEIGSYVRNHGPGLTAKEVEVLTAVSHGLEPEMAAEALGKSVFTVNDQLKSARYKLRAKNRAHAVATALRRGLID